MPTEYVLWEYGESNLEIIKYTDGTEDHVARIIVGGKDKYGEEYSLVLEGPAAGEKVYGG